MCIRDSYESRGVCGSSIFPITRKDLWRQSGLHSVVYRYSGYLLFSCILSDLTVHIWSLTDQTGNDEYVSGVWDLLYGDVVIYVYLWCHLALGLIQT